MLKGGGKVPGKFIYMVKGYKEMKMAQTRRNLGGGTLCRA